MDNKIKKTLNNQLELYRLLYEGRTAIQEGKKQPLSYVIRDVKQDIADGKYMVKESNNH